MVIVYNECGRNEGKLINRIINEKIDIGVTKHELKIPAGADNYDAFAAQIRANEIVYVQVLVG